MFLNKLSKVRSPILLRRVVGHSMVPVLPPGTLVVGHIFVKKIKPGDVVVVIHEDREKIKRISELANGKIFVLGDHLDASKDSRHFGWLENDSVKAKIFWPKAKKLKIH